MRIKALAIIIWCLMAQAQMRDTQAGASISIHNGALDTESGSIGGNWKEDFRRRTITELDIGRITIFSPGAYVMDVDLNIVDLFSPTWIHADLWINGELEERWTHYHRSDGTPESISMHGMMWLETGDSLEIRLDYYDVVGVNPVTGELILSREGAVNVMVGQLRVIRYTIPRAEGGE